MSNEIEIKKMDTKTVEALILNGDCSKLTSEQRIQYYAARCEMLGLDVRAKPFEFINLSGKLVLYAGKECTAQLSNIHKIRTRILSQETDKENMVRVVVVEAETGVGHGTQEVGAVSIAGLKAGDLANAYKKAVTQAKRRAILSMCGLGVLDESEVEDVTPAPTKPKITDFPSQEKSVEVKTVEVVPEKKEEKPAAEKIAAPEAPSTAIKGASDKPPETPKPSAAASSPAPAAPAKVQAPDPALLKGLRDAMNEFVKIMDLKDLSKLPAMIYPEGVNLSKNIKPDQYFGVLKKIVAHYEKKGDVKAEQYPALTAILAKVQKILAKVQK